MKFGILKTSIGHILINILLSKPKKEKIILFYVNTPAVNQTLISILRETYKKEIIFIGSNILASLIYRAVKCELSFLKWFKKFYINTYESHISTDVSKIYGSQYKVWNDSIKAPRYIVPPKIEQQFSDWFEKLDISEKFVCVYSRDSGFYPLDLEGVVRNSSFENLFPTIEYLISQGYFVIRIGRGGKEVKHNFSSKNYLDINRIKNCPDYVDVMLFKYAKFIVGSNSGIMNLSLLFDTPILACNWFPVGIQPFFPKCKYMLKKYTKNGKLINYSQIPKQLLLCESKSLLLQNGYDVVENTAEEILNFIIRNMKLKFETHNHKYDFIVYGGNAVLEN
jgi:putative glycosyltransferase (TIGR04372 family)